MGSTASTEKTMIAAIERHDLDAMKLLMKNLTSEEITSLCKFLVPNNSFQCTVIHYAAWQDKPDLLALLLDYVDDLEVRDALGWTPLMTAVNRDSKENVNLLLQRGAKVDCDSVKGMDLIAIAMSFHDLEMVEILINHGAQVSCVPDFLGGEENAFGCYLLHFAVDDGLCDIAKLLIEKGHIPINELDQSGWSPLHLAAAHNYLDIVRLLLEHGAIINITDYDGNTPLAWAKNLNSTDVIPELERYGAVADEEWHGDRLKLFQNYDHNEENQYRYGCDIAQFEIDDSTYEQQLKEKSPIVLDALQLQH